MKRLSLLIVLVVVMVGGPLVAPRTIDAQAELSSGCEWMNRTLYFYAYTTGADYEFWAGETVAVTMIPSDGLVWTSILWGITGTSISVTGDDYITYTFTEDVTGNNGIFFSLGTVTPGATTPSWQLSCTAAGNDSLAGSDMVPIPDTAVVGMFLDWTPLHYLPVTGAMSDYYMEPGQSLYAFGMDASGQFYKVLMSGKFFWVPVAAMGPNHDDVWNGTPLPVIVVH